MKIGDKLYCKKDFHCRHKTFECKKGNVLTIFAIEYNNDNSGYISGYGISNGANSTYLYIKSDSWDKRISYMWNYFVTIETKCNRIRKIAKQFIV